jgi:hypothetical protein
MSLCVAFHYMRPTETIQAREPRWRFELLTELLFIFKVGRSMVICCVYTIHYSFLCNERSCAYLFSAKWYFYVSV